MLTVHIVIDFLYNPPLYINSHEPFIPLIHYTVHHVPSPSAVCTMSRALNGPKATVKALTEKLYWVPGDRLDSTIVVELSVVFT